jgi:hypothetical protein
VREAKQLYERAAGEAWADVERRAAEAAAAVPGKKLELVQVSYDPLPGESVIDELPDQPKSSRPRSVAVSVRVRAVYLLR